MRIRGEHMIHLLVRCSPPSNPVSTPSVKRNGKDGVGEVRGGCIYSPLPPKCPNKWDEKKKKGESQTQRDSPSLPLSKYEGWELPP